MSSSARTPLKKMKTQMYAAYLLLCHRTTIFAAMHQNPLCLRPSRHAPCVLYALALACICHTGLCLESLDGAEKQQHQQQRLDPSLASKYGPVVVRTLLALSYLAAEPGAAVPGVTSLDVPYSTNSRVSLHRVGLNHLVVAFHDADTVMDAEQWKENTEPVPFLRNVSSVHGNVCSFLFHYEALLALQYSTHELCNTGKGERIVNAVPVPFQKNERKKSCRLSTAHRPPLLWFQPFPNWPQGQVQAALYPPP
jgi:hypothetical protein